MQGSRPPSPVARRSRHAARRDAIRTRRKTDEHDTHDGAAAHGSGDRDGHHRSQLDRAVSRGGPAGAGQRSCSRRRGAPARLCGRSLVQHGTARAHGGPYARCGPAGPDGACQCRGGCAGSGLRAGERTRAARHQAAGVCRARIGAGAGCDHCLVHLRHHAQHAAGRHAAPGAAGGGTPLQPAASDSAGGSGAGQADVRSHGAGRAGALSRPGQDPHPAAQGSGGTHRQPAAGRHLARSGLSGTRGRGFGGRHRSGRLCRAGAALVHHGAEHDLQSGRRAGGHGAFSGAPGPGAGNLVGGPGLAAPRRRYATDAGGGLRHARSRPLHPGGGTP